MAERLDGTLVPAVRREQRSLGRPEKRLSALCIVEKRRLERERWHKPYWLRAVTVALVV